MAHGSPKLEYGDPIICQPDPGNHEAVTHEPITVAGPSDADNPIVEERFGQQGIVGAPVTADYGYDGELDLSGDECEIELCHGDEDGNFQGIERPLRLGFKAVEVEDDDDDDDPCRMVFLGTCNHSGSCSCSAATVAVPSQASYQAVRQDVDKSTDTDGFTWTISAIWESQADYTGVCAQEVDYGPSCTATTTTVIDPAIQSCSSLVTFPAVISQTTSVSGPAGGDSCSGDHGDCTTSNSYCTPLGNSPPCTSVDTGNKDCPVAFNNTHCSTIGQIRCLPELVYKVNCPYSISTFEDIFFGPAGNCSCCG